VPEVRQKWDGTEPVPPLMNESAASTNAAAFSAQRQLGRRVLRRAGRFRRRADAPEQKPLLDVATQTTFLLLENEPPRELVVGTVIAAPRAAREGGRLQPALFRRTLRPGVVLATMNFLVTPDEGGGSTVTTETRIYANSSSVLRQFGVYWRLIHPGSDIIRRMWLRAIARRAEQAQVAVR
jgi:hypothetical protein